MDLDVEKGNAWIRALGKNTVLVHWGTRFTRQLLYKKQVAALECLRAEKPAYNRWLSDTGYDIRILGNKAGRFAVRVCNKLKRMLHLA
jgi:predicted phage tail protein